MKITFKKIKNMLAEAFKIFGKKIESKVEKKPEDQIKSENDKFWGLGKQKAGHSTTFKSQLDAKQKRKRRSNEKIKKHSRIINRRAA